MRHFRPNKSCQVPTQHIILDTETIPGEPFGPRQTRIHKFRLASACFFRWEQGKPTREKWITTNQSSEMLNWIAQRVIEKRLTWVWAHSAKFDWTSLKLWKNLEAKEFILKYASIEGKPNFLVTYFGKKPCWWIDSLNWWSMPLAELGKSVKIPKLPMPDFVASDSKWATYCRRDVEILRAAVVDLLGWVVDNDLGCLRLSAPGQAMQAYKHRFAPRTTRMLPVQHKDGSITREQKELCLPLNHSVDDVKKLERRSYFQGAVRVNYIGEINGPVYCLDVNSCYPSVMLDGLVPSELLSFDCSLANNCSFPTDLIGECIADVKIHTTEPDYPLRQSSHCVYPVGTFWTTLAGPELLYANEKGCIIQFGRWARYKLENLFGDYVRCLWDLRCKYRDSGNRAREAICKTLLNSLAGKFGQRSHKWEKDTEVEWPEPWGHFDIINAATKEVKHYRSIAWLIERQQKPGEHPESFPAVVAWVTSLARVKMLKILEVANGRGNYYYSAVDSCFVDAGGLRALDEAKCINGLLGGLRQDRIATKLEIRGIANYSIEDELHVAGLSKSATKKGLDKVSWQSLSVPSVVDGTKGSFAITDSTITRSITPPYVHGKVNPDGSTRPWILPLEEEEMTKCLQNSTVTNIFA